MPLTPNNREEHWLQGMVDGETTLTPNNRREHWYEEIINASGGGGGGTGGGVLVVHAAVIEEGYIDLDKTWNEINNAPFAVLVKSTETSKVILPLIQTSGQPNSYSVAFWDYVSTPDTYYADTADGNPYKEDK